MAAAVASRAAARPKVKQLDEAFSKAGLLALGQLLAEHDAALESAAAKLMPRLDQPEAEQVRELCQTAVAESETSWSQQQASLNARGSVPRTQWTGMAADDGVRPAHGGDTCIGGAGPSQSEQSRMACLSVGSLQQQLWLLMDNTQPRRLVVALELSGRYSDMRRLEELRDPSVDRSWIRRLDYMDGPVLSDNNYAICLQLCLGADMLPDSCECPECGRLVDTHLSHAPAVPRRNAQRVTTLSSR